MTAWEENDEAVQAGSRRKGYMGHVTKICNVIVGATEKGSYAPLLSSLLEGMRIYSSKYSGSRNFHLQLLTT